MKTWKKVNPGMIKAGVLILAVCVALLILSRSTDVIDNSVEYYTKEELSELFWQNKELLNRVKDSMLSNDKVLQALIDEQDGDTGIYLKQDEDYFSQEEWQDVETAFKTFHPIMLMLERKGRPLKFYICFDDLKIDSNTKTTSLYWFPDVKEIKYNKEVSLADSIEYTHLDGNWYIVEEIYPW